MTQLFAIKIGELETLASGTWDDWEETFEALEALELKAEYKKFSDYTGPTIECDQLAYYSSFPNECPVLAPSWLFR